MTQETNDKQQLAQMLLRVKENTGRLPDKASADSGFFSAAQLRDERIASVDLYVAPDKEAALAQKEAAAQSAAGGSEESLVAQTRAKLTSEAGRAVYKMRKAIVEPVFGQIKEVRGFRRFSLRGLWAVSREWELVCLTHNLLKLFGSGGLAPTWAGVRESVAGSRVRACLCHSFLARFLFLLIAPLARAIARFWRWAPRLGLVYRPMGATL